MTKQRDNQLALIFLLLTIAFVLTCMFNKTFFDWVFERHHNQLSWYIRPLFLIPFCFLAYKQSWTGISVTIFLLFTSMFWFNKPETTSEEVQQFLQYEKDWLNAPWDYKKWLMILTVPLSFFVLGLAFWKRSLLIGLGVVILMATGKIVWSIYNAGDAGKSIIAPAIIGLILCFILILLGIKRLNQTES